MRLNCEQMQEMEPVCNASVTLHGCSRCSHAGNVRCSPWASLSMKHALYGIGIQHTRPTSGKTVVRWLSQSWSVGSSPVAGGGVGWGGVGWGGGVGGGGGTAGWHARNGKTRALHSSTPANFPSHNKSHLAARAACPAGSLGTTAPPRCGTCRCGTQSTWAHLARSPRSCEG